MTKKLACLLSFDLLFLLFTFQLLVFMSKLEREQELLHHKLAEIINQEVAIEGALLTVGFVDLSHDLKRAKIGISVLPDKFYGRALEELRRATGQIRSRLAHELNWRVTPRLIWAIDNREKNAAALDEVFRWI